MSAHTAHSGSSSDSRGALSSQSCSSPIGLSQGGRWKPHSKPDMSERENADPLLSSARKTRDINLTYVISACEKPRDTPLPPNPTGRLTLQRRVTRNKESSLPGSEVGGSPERKTETPLRLQRCARSGSVDKRTTAGTGSVDKWTTTGTGSVDRQTTARTGSVDRQTTAGTGSVDRQTTAGTSSVDNWTVTQNVGGAAESNRVSQETSVNVRLVSNDKNSRVASSAPSAEDTDTGLVADGKDKGPLSALREAKDSVTREYFSHSTPVRSQHPTEAVRPGPSATKPVQSKLDVRVSVTGNFHPWSLGKDIGKNTNKVESFGKRTPAKGRAEATWTPRGGTPQRPAVSTLTPRTPSSQGQQKPKRSLFTNKREGPREHPLPPKEDAAAQSTATERDPLQVESSQVTVAVRVRPFSKREKEEDATQVVFLDGEEIAVRHPDMRQEYSFLYDVSFWSFDEGHPRYASQAAVYETLAAPLLARALEGYNACLFAYGQTGSGKSYTMMGFGEEPGIIPRFCEDLFAQVAKKQTQEVRYHLEMSFFEVYNEKIHDLLVGKGESGQRKQPLRVREHPVSGPYVEALAVNAVSSYSDIQGWLQLGSKQRATAATGMNDKSSRSHSVLTLVMTRTQAELVAGEEHDHTVTSRISLVDLAGSERQGPAGTSGQLLREGVSINKSLLTLGKVISALAEHGSRRGAFVPYRESVLTWLLKESLGGNSKTAMIATVSPAASSVEETLSTLRYAHQARSIVNVARVNEDASAQLIRELKAEIEKLKAAQRSRQNVDPERYRLCRQEITSLRMRLHQQERDMAEMQRAWKEKFEQAEKRKHQEMKELQKAGITFQMDIHLPHLVNLSEDPQLSEMLLYVIKEGTTSVGRRGPASSPDIQLAGVLVAEDHCTLSNVGGTVSIAPVGEARTYVNGRRVSEPTVLRHGDRVVLGGDHYFRFNHPAQVQEGRRPPAGGAPTSEGPKDFEFARNELLAAQRSQLEAEVREAQLQAAQETLQGIQVARDLAEQELSSQRAAFERRIEALEAELKEESHRKKMQEISNQTATHRIEELEKAKQRLEQEVQVARRLEAAGLAAKQALEDHSLRHTRILEALEAEKQKIAQEVRALQQSGSRRDRALTVPTSWGSLKLSMMIQEANALSARFQRQYVFGRHETPDKGGGPGPRVRVRNLRLGVSTLWSLEKFEAKLAALKELYENNHGSRCEDLFCDPEDEWEPDITDTPLASLSRRRSRSLVKHRRVSGYLHDLHAARHPHASRSSGSGERSGSLCCSSAGSALPGICRELIGSSLAVLGRSGEERTLADSLVDSLLRVHSGLLAVAQAHAAQDEESPEDLFSDREAQARAVQVACAFGQLVVLVPHWLGGVPPGPSTAGLGDELRQAVETLGGHVQLFLQGCSSDIPAMVLDAQRKVTQVTQRALVCVGQLAVLSGNKLRLLDTGGHQGAGGQEDLAGALGAGLGAGARMQLESGLATAGELRRRLRGQRPQSEGARQLSAKAEALIGCLETMLAEWKNEVSSARAQEGPSGCEDLRKAAEQASECSLLTRCLEQMTDIIISALRGRRGDGRPLRDCVERICSLAGDQSRGDLGPAAKSLLLCFEAADRPGPLGPWETGRRTSAEGHQPPRASGTGPAGGAASLSASMRCPPGPRGTQWV